MARSFLVVLIASLPLTGAWAQSEPASPPPPPPAADGRPGGPKPPGPPPDKSSRGERKERASREEDRRFPKDDDGPLKRFKKRYQEMTPEEREHFRKNFQRWKNMPEGEKKHWKDQAVAERSRVRKTIEDAIASTGLNLTKDQKEVFALRYRQERCRVEEKLRKEFEGRRDEEMKGVIERLKQEFSASPAATPTPAPTP